MRGVALVLILTLVLPVRCLSIAGILIGDSKPVQRPGAGYLTGFTADLLAAAKIGGSAGAVYAGLVLLFPVIAVIYSVMSRTPPDPEYDFPVFRRSPQGTALRTFTGSMRRVALVVDPGPALDERGGEERFGWLRSRLPGRVHGDLASGSYFRILPMEGDDDLGAVRALNEVIRMRSRYAEKAQVELILHVRFLNPVTSCGVEEYVDPKVCEARSLSDRADAPECRSKSTGFRMFHLRMEGNLIRIDTGEILRSRAEGPGIELKQYGPAGNEDCPQLYNIVEDALVTSENILKRDLVPLELRARESRMVTQHSNSAVTKHLSDGVALLKGARPSLEKAAVHWKEALELSGGESEGALGNLGIYALVTGRFDEADAYVIRASDAKGADKKYWQEMKMRMRSMSVP